MYLTALSLHHEMSRFPGGPAALAASLRGGIEALRPLRWPADRLETLGGYLWYHNMTLLTLFLSVYGGVQGARAVRRGEDDHSLEQVLATGRPRNAIVRDRTLGFCVTLGLIAAGIGTATAVSMAAGGESRVAGSFITLGAISLCALVAYALGLLVSQLTASSRAAAGITSVVLVGLYVGTNVSDEVALLGPLRFVSPFHYAEGSRALVPGFGFDLGSTLALVLMAAGLLAAGTWCFERRDYGAALWVRRRSISTLQPVVVQRRLLDTVCTAMLLRGRLGLAAWALSAAAYSAMVAALQPSVMKVWTAFESFAGIAGGRQGIAPAAQYMSFAVELVMPMVAAYVVTQAAGWVADLEQGRVEMVLAAPVSWSRLVWERMLAATIGAAIVAAAALGALALAGLAVDAPIAGGGLARSWLACVLFAAALSGAAAVLVAVLRTGVATAGLAVFLAASYLVGLLGAMLEWPTWIGRLSIFTAFGHPYLQWPPASGLLVLCTFAAAGAAVAAATAERTPKVA